MLTTYHHPVPLSRNLGSLNFLEPSKPVQACNGIALPFLHNLFVIRFSGNWSVVTDCSNQTESSGLFFIAFIFVCGHLFNMHQDFVLEHTASIFKVNDCPSTCKKEALY